MEELRTDVDVASISCAETKRRVGGVVVNNNAMLTWLPHDVLEECGIEPIKQVLFRLSDRTEVTRWIGIAFICVAGRRTVDEIVFAQVGDPITLGARSLGGLNLRVDMVLKQLVDAGPAPAAAAA